MDLSNEFTVDVPIERAWAVLIDVEAIAPCLPGAQLQEIEGEEYRGIVKVKVGPITAQYKGTAVFVELDEANHRVVLKGEGRDTRGQGNASALITAVLVAAGPSSTRVTVTTDLTVTGKVAQFGRGVMADVSGKLMTQFADNLSATVLGPAGAAAPAVSAEDVPAVGEEPAPAPAVPATTPGTGHSIGVDTSAAPASGGVVRKLNLPEPEPIDLMGTAGAPMMKRVLPAIGLVALIVLIVRLVRGRG